MKRINAFWLFTFFIFLVIFLPSVLKDGMFLDGITYSAISKNLANGLGDFFNPHYSKTIHANFYEHPPLVFGIQSMFFKVLGDSYYTERVFGLFITLLTFLGVTLIWSLFWNKDREKFSWIPVAFWISIPLVMWSYRNNLLENTMGVFTLFSSYFILKSLIKNSWAWLVFGGLFIVLGLLSKGPVAFFPLSIPLIYGLVYKTKNYSLFTSFWLIVAVLLIGSFFIFLFPELYKNMAYYLNKQLFPAINNTREITTNTRFFILFLLLKELLFPVLLGAGVFLLTCSKKIAFDGVPKTTVLFGLIAFAASIPLMISLKQRDFYLVPALPFFALSIGFFLKPHIQSLIDLFSEGVLMVFKKTIVFSFLILIGLLLFSDNGSSRDSVLLSDVYKISAEITEGGMISYSKELQTNWLLIAYLSRIGYLSLDKNKQHQYLLIIKGETYPKDYKKVNIDLELFCLLSKTSL